jgi:hypothetical protein
MLLSGVHTNIEQTFAAHRHECRRNERISPPSPPDRFALDRDGFGDHGHTFSILFRRFRRRLVYIPKRRERVNDGEYFSEVRHDLFLV